MCVYVCAYVCLDLMQIRLFSIQHIAEVWSECNSPPLRLQCLEGSGGLVLAEYADSSVRLLDATSNEVRDTHPHTHTGTHTHTHTHTHICTHRHTHGHTHGHTHTHTDTYTGLLDATSKEVRWAEGYTHIHRSDAALMIECVY